MHHSKGAFTVDFSRWVSKVVQFSTHDIANYVRHLVSAGTALQARCLRTQCESHSWEFWLDCPELGLDDCKRIFPSLVMTEPGARGIALRELALTLIHLRGMRDVSVHLRSGSGELELWPHYLRVSPAPSFVKGLRIEVASLSLWRRLSTPGLPASKWWPQPLPRLQLESAKRSVRYSPLITPSVAETDEWRGEGAAVLRGRAILPELPGQPEILTESLHDGEFTALAVFFPLRSGAGLIVQNWGQLFELSCKWNLPVRVFLAHDGLRRDLLGRQLLLDKNYGDVLTKVRHFLATVTGHLIVNDPSWSRRLRELVQDGWLRGRLRSQVDAIPCIRLGGWPQALTPSQVVSLHAKQGFLHFDPTLSNPKIFTALSKKFGNLIWQTPYKPLAEVEDGIWLIRIPFEEGEIRYPASVTPERPVAGKPLPPGTVLTANFTSEDRVAGARLLAQVFLRLLKTDKKRFVGSIAALQFALWLLPDYPKLSKLMYLRRGLSLQQAIDNQGDLSNEERWLLRLEKQKVPASSDSEVDKR